VIVSTLISERLEVDLALEHMGRGPRIRIGSPGAQAMVSDPPGMRP
jgi:phosphoenolpyruvate carboxylase